MARFILWLGLASLTFAQSSSGFAGVWSLNRSVSDFPKELGFNIVEVPPPDGQAAPSSGRGRRGSAASGRTGATPFSGPRESYEDGQRMRLVTDEARNPPSRLTIVDNAAAIVITNELGQSRTFHPTNKEEAMDIQGIPFTVTTARDGARLVVTYHVEQDRSVRYTYSSSTAPARLTVETQFLEQGKGDKVTRVYEAGAEVAAARTPAASQSPAEPARDTFDQRPGAEFRGLKSVGILVEDLGAEATGCGLKRDAIEDALARKLTAGGLSVRKNSDEDTYVYVNVITTAMPNGTCV